MKIQPHFSWINSANGFIANKSHICRFLSISHFSASKGRTKCFGKVWKFGKIFVLQSQSIRFSHWFSKTFGNLLSIIGIYDHFQSHSHSIQTNRKLSTLLNLVFVFAILSLCESSQMRLKVVSFCVQNWMNAINHSEQW